MLYILLSGSMPFFGSDEEQKKNIQRGCYNMKPQRWGHISAEAKDCVCKLLEVSPGKRLTAQAALEHPWIHKYKSTPCLPCGNSLQDALRRHAEASAFQRC